MLCSLLASGSDDVQVIIWDPFRTKQLTTIRTGHNGNIFSVKVCPLLIVIFYYAHSAVLTWYMICPVLWLSVTSWSSVKTTEQIGFICGTVTILSLSYTSYTVF